MIAAAGKSIHEFRLDVDQMVSEVKDIFGDGKVLRCAVLLYEAVDKACREADEEAALDDEPVHPFYWDQREFEAENPCIQMDRHQLGEYEEYEAAHACGRMRDAEAMRWER